MAAERFVVLGLAPARSHWFRSVGLWANSGALPAEFVRCISAEEVRARLASGRAFSALVADAGLPAVDRDLVAAARSVDCAVLVVDDGRVMRDWLELGAARVLPPSFGRDELVAALTSYSHPVRRGDADASDLLARPAPAAWRGSVAALTGSGGTGVSTAAIALTQCMADDVRHGGMVLLADLRLRAEHAVLHDAGDVLPCVQELVESHRSGQPTADDVRAVRLSRVTVVVPDVLVARSADLTPARLKTAPVLAVEVGSPSTALIDRAPSDWSTRPPACPRTGWSTPTGPVSRCCTCTRVTTSSTQP